MSTDLKKIPQTNQFNSSYSEPRCCFRQNLKYKLNPPSPFHPALGGGEEQISFAIFAGFYVPTVMAGKS